MIRASVVGLALMLVLDAAMAGAQIPARTLLVLNKEGNVAIVDAATGTVVGRVPVGPDPHEVAIAPDGRFAVTSNYGTAERPGSTLSVIDLASRTEVRRVDIAPLLRPHGLFFDGTGCWFTAEGSRIVARLNPASGKVDWLQGTGQNGTHMVTVAGGRVFASNIQSDSVSVFEQGQGGWSHTVIPVGKGPEGFDVTPDGRQLWAAGSADGRVTVVDLATRKAIDSFDVKTKRSNRLRFTPDGALVFISDVTTGELIVLDRASRAEKLRLAVAPKGIAGIEFSTDGTTAWIAATTDNFIAVFDVKSLRITGRLETGVGPDGMAYLAK